MTIDVLFIQGGGANVHDAWDHALVASLERELGPDYRVRYPRMPGEDDPHAATWKPAIARELDALSDGAVLVGHSVGATILVHVLAEQTHRVKPRALVLIAAPFIGEGGWPSDEIVPRTDLAERLPPTVLLFHGADDATVPPGHVQLYARAIPQARVQVLPHRDHQLNNDLAEVARAMRASRTDVTGDR